MTVVTFGIFLMKAAVIREHSGLDRLRIEEVPEPKLVEDEVILKVYSNVCLFWGWTAFFS
jgi:D-arabinose 1-dehydrogenase-like Zn-dependent alcohol dehydrogenase